MIRVRVRVRVSLSLTLTLTLPGTGDYDKRTAIHLAASEGKLDVVKVIRGDVGEI